MTTIISTVFGALSALLQNIIEKKQERKLEEQRNDNFIRLEEMRIQTEKLKVKVAGHQSYSAFTNAVAKINRPLSGKHKSERIANFIVTLTRPILTFILVGLVVSLCLKSPSTDIIKPAFATLDYILGYWFVRRSFEKNR